MRHNDRKPPQMDIKDDLKTVLEKLIEHTFDKVQWINWACRTQPTPRVRFYRCVQCMAEVQGTRASLSFITGHWNWFPNFLETIHGVLSLDIGTGFQIFRRRFTGKSHSGHEKGNHGHEFQCDGAKCINPCFEAATAPNQTLEPVRNEDERPFPAFEFGVAGRNNTKWRFRQSWY